jgi:murein DD-endopeptidase MepM/ murein hydrolase activator NlpD
MFRFLSGLLMGAFLAFCGWVMGTFYPAPAALTDFIQQRQVLLAHRLGEVNLQSLQGVLSPDQLHALQTQASDLAARAGQAILVEHVSDEDVRNVEAVSMTPVSMTLPGVAVPPTAPSAPAGAASAFDAAIFLCPGMTVSNAPAADATRRVLHYTPTVDVQGVALGLDPTHGACLSSGFGARSSGVHKGIDYYSASGGRIDAAADGTIIERVYRDDYGNMLLIDHGHGVYTRYAHMSSFADGIVEGAHVRAGQQLGLMGNTASYQNPIHLHYELLLGDYSNPKKSFGLTPHSPFEYMRG